MKKILFITATLLCSLWCSAQGGQVAVLYHDNEIKTFYSTTAFKEAMANAADGDVITLSPGSFEAADITKAVTIRGAGIGAVDANSSESAQLTSINGNVKVIVPTNDSGYTLSVEGIDFKNSLSTTDVQDAIFSKTRFNTLKDGSFGGSNPEPCGRNLTFFHCIINGDGNFRFGGFNFYNCQVYFHNTLSSHRKNETFQNCIISISDDSQSGPATYNNCVFVSTKIGASVKSGQDAFNCVWVGPHADKGPFSDGNNSKPERHNSVVPEGTEIFVDGTFYVLNEAGLKYLGNDGTQVGLYGSDLPFSTKTSYPRIKKLRVSPESTNDGMLKIEFELDADI